VQDSCSRSQLQGYSVLGHNRRHVLADWELCASWEVGHAPEWNGCNVEGHLRGCVDGYSWVASGNRQFADDRNRRKCGHDACGVHVVA